MSQYQTTVVKKPCNHVLHLILTMITFGMWLPVWIIMAMVGRTETQQVQNQPVWWAQNQVPVPAPVQKQWNPYKGEWQ